MANQAVYKETKLSLPKLSLLSGGRKSFIPKLQCPQQEAVTATLKTCLDINEHMTYNMNIYIYTVCMCIYIYKYGCALHVIYIHVYIYIHIVCTVIYCTVEGYWIHAMSSFSLSNNQPRPIDPPVTLQLHFQGAIGRVLTHQVITSCRCALATKNGMLHSSTFSVFICFPSSQSHFYVHVRPVVLSQQPAVSTLPPKGR